MIRFMDKSVPIESSNERKRKEEAALIMRVAAETKTAVVTGPAGVRWQGLATLDWVTKVDLLLPGTSKAWCASGQYPDRVYHGGALDPARYQTLNGVRVASLIQCLFDSYRYHGRLEALVQIESARWRWPELTTDNLLKRSHHLRRAAGIQAFEQLIRYSTHTSQSPLETLTRDTLLKAVNNGQLARVESVACQVCFSICAADGSPTIAVVDFLINDFLVIEADGDMKTDGTFGEPELITQSERRREKELQNLGLVVLRVSWKSVSGGQFLAQLDQLLNAYPRPAVRPPRAVPPPSAA